MAGIDSPLEQAYKAAHGLSPQKPDWVIDGLERKQAALVARGGLYFGRVGLLVRSVKNRNAKPMGPAAHAFNEIGCAVQEQI